MKASLRKRMDYVKDEPRKTFTPILKVPVGAVAAVLLAQERAAEALHARHASMACAVRLEEHLDRAPGS